MAKNDKPSFRTFISDWLMKTAQHKKEQKLNDAEEAISSPYYHGGDLQRTYLTSRSDQKREILRRGFYIEGTPGDYGLVKNAVGDRDIPVYQRAPDEAKREDLIVIGNPKSLNVLPEKDLINAGTYPIAGYVDPTTINDVDWEKGIRKSPTFYQKAWDLNDYGGSGGSTSGLLGKIADFIGNPTIQTTGFQKVVFPDVNALHPDEMNKLLDDTLKKKGLVKHVINYDRRPPRKIDTLGRLRYDESHKPLYAPRDASYYFYGLPELFVIGKNKRKTLKGKY